MKILDNFKLTDEREDFDIVSTKIHNEIDFKGTNLWILIFAIFIASLGLNVNSTAVIIGAMLISPLMGPIIGMGFGMAINDLFLLKKSFSTYLFGTAVGLATSTVYFLFSPIDDAHSELLARTAPNLYDVLIAFFGGLAGILAVSSKLKGNVIPGVAIATALMPPLCTAGYGLATLQFTFFFGALYLFLINTVFIALATLITSRFLDFPFKQLPEKKDEHRANRIVWGIVIITLLPSIYFGYDMVQQNRYLKRANQFIEFEAVFPNDYLLKKTIDTKKRTITLTYGGQEIPETEILKLKAKLSNYKLEKSTLNIQQGFAYLKDSKMDEKTNQLTRVLKEKEEQVQLLQHKVDSTAAQNRLSRQFYSELKTQYPDIQSLVLQPARNHSDSTNQTIWISVVRSGKQWETSDMTKIKDWMKVRLKVNEIIVYYE